MPKKIEINKEEFYQYYMVENHSQEETAKYFGVCRDVIKRHVKEYGFKKTKEQIQAKTRATNKERRGVEYTWQDPVVQAKSRATNMERRGFEYPMQDPEVQAKARATFLEEYGFENPMQNPEVQTKWRATCREKYGTEHPMQDPKVQDKWRTTNKERRGFENPMQDPKVQAKRRATCREIYGTDNPMQNSEVQAKARATNMERRGFENPAQDPEVQEKKQETRKRNGSGLNNKDLDYYIIEKWLEDRGVGGTTYAQLTEFMENNLSSAWAYVKGRPELKKFINRHPSISKPQHEVYEFIKENYGGEVIEGDRKVIAPKEIDILLPALKFGIEFNGLYHHLTYKLPSTNRHKDKCYHRDKALAALEKGHRLIFITDDEWRDSQEEVKTRILDMLANKQDVSNILGYTEPDYCYVKNGNRYFRNDKKLPEILTTAFTLEEDGWDLAESAGYYRYYDCGSAKYELKYDQERGHCL